MNDSLTPWAHRLGQMPSLRSVILALACLATVAPAGAAPAAAKGHKTSTRGQTTSKPGTPKPAAKTAAPSAAPAAPAASPTGAPAPETPATSAPAATQKGDYIIVVVNREMITAGELSKRVESVMRNAQAAGATLPPPDQIQQQVLDAMIDERVLLSHARESGPRVEEAEVDRIVASQAQQSQLTVAQLMEQLRAEGADLNALRKDLRDQLQVERTRDRELQSRVKVTDAEIDEFLDQRLEAAGMGTQYNIAQVLIKVPEGASEAQVSEKRRLAERALERLKSGEPMRQVALELSDDESKTRGGEFGLRTANRLPDMFVNAVRGLSPGQVVTDILRTGAGFHVLQLVERRSPTTIPMAQTRASHILLRTSQSLNRNEALQRLADWRDQVLTGRKTFEALAREFSQDGSAPQGGDLGWTLPGTFVPEFEATMNQLPVGGISEPTISRFGIHLIKVVDRKQIPVEIKKLRDMARSALREQKSEAALSEWLQELRSRAFIEYREVPQ